MIKQFIVVIVLALSSQYVSAQFGLSGGATYVLDEDALGIQAKGFLDFGDSDFRGAGTFSYYLNSSLSWSIDLDAHYKLIEFGNESVTFNPFGGVNIVDKGIETDIGINVGAYTEFSIGDEKYIYIEPKLTIGGLASFVISAGYKL